MIACAVPTLGGSILPFLVYKVSLQKIMLFQIPIAQTGLKIKGGERLEYKTSPHSSKQFSALSVGGEMVEVLRDNAELPRVLSRIRTDGTQKPAASDRKPLSRESPDVPECAAKVASVSSVCPDVRSVSMHVQTWATHLSVLFILAAPRMTLLCTRFLLKTVLG